MASALVCHYQVILAIYESSTCIMSSKIYPSGKPGRNSAFRSLEDIAAFKLDAICHRKEKKDYVDIAILLERFSFGQMLSF